MLAKRKALNISERKVNCLDLCGFSSFFCCNNLIFRSKVVNFDIREINL